MLVIDIFTVMCWGNYKTIANEACSPREPRVCFDSVFTQGVLHSIRVMNTLLSHPVICRWSLIIFCYLHIYHLQNIYGPYRLCFYNLLPSVPSFHHLGFSQYWISKMKGGGGPPLIFVPCSLSLAAALGPQAFSFETKTRKLGFCVHARGVALYRYYILIKKTY